MADETMFETRLAAALGRYADLAPPMDDEAVARAAIEAGGPRRTGWLATIGHAILNPISPAPSARAAYLLLILALLMAAILVAVASGFFRTEPLPVPGQNGAIVYTFGGNNHQAVAAVAIAPDGTGRHQVDAGRCPTYSRDGRVLTWLAYEESAAYLVIASSGGTQTGRVLLVDSAQASVPYAVSSDGTRVAWLKPAHSAPAESAPSDGPPSRSDQPLELWAAPVDTGDGVRLVGASSVPGEVYGSPSWSPDGRWIAFGIYVGREFGGRRIAIDVVAADGSDRHRVTDHPGPAANDDVAWSPDGRYLAYVGLPAAPTTTGGDQTAPTARTDVFVVSADGTDERNLTDTQAAEHHPDWSPDGAYLGFETSADGEADRVTSIRIDGASPVGPPALGPASDWFVWSPDGRQLLWQELTSLGSEKFQTTLHAIDRDFRQPPTTLQVVDGLVVCTPSWQRLEG
jgi:Tol biopolymer transport system component